ncbi:uncharacterized protein LOC111048556 [Nilaparvata lugens]|uniref:uncharacterized protein LOC111048556 n=1 Tax=Nilaparvata lugens TaxID=108931 RepID=UPI00193E46F5|nr:uncharacterized protein LOC111048556 [Nilaparvata lugens]
MTESSTDKGHKVIDQLKSMSGIPNLSLFLLEARTYEELHNYIFCEESHRIQLLKILFAQVDDKLESMLNSTSKRESEILDTLKNLCVSYGFTNRENSRPFIIGKMSLENQCSIWEMIIEGIKSIMNYENVSNELENDIVKVNMFFKNPLLNEFLSFFPRETGQEQQPNHCNSATLDCHIQNTKLKLEHYKDLELSSTEDEQSALEYNVPSLLMQQNLLDSIQKWEIGFQSNLENNLNNTSQDKAAIELSNKQNDVRISQSIKTLRSFCSRIEKNLENQKVVTELADRVIRS